MAKGYRSQMLATDEYKRRSFARMLREEMVERERPRALLMGIDMYVTAVGIFLMKADKMHAFREPATDARGTVIKPWLVESLSQKALHKEIDSLFQAMTGKKLPKEEA
jgi:hypothetical protein